MKRSMNTFMPAMGIGLVAGILAVGTPAFGAGFQLNEHGAIGTGRSGAIIGTVRDPSAVFHNPAGLTRAEGTQFVGGVSLIRAGGEYTGRGLAADPLEEVVSQKTEQNFVPVPHAYVSHEISKTAYVGFGFYNHYGLGLVWDNPDEFVGRTIAQEISLRTFFLTPTVALRLSENVSIAVGVSFVPATLTLTRVIGATDNDQVVFPATGNNPEGTVDLQGDAFGVGATAGIQLNFVEHLWIGLSYRSAVKLSFEGEADFQLPSDIPASVAANFPDQTINGELTLPHTLLAGIGWETEHWTVELAGQVTFWTSYDELRLNFDAGLPTPTTALDRDWRVAPMARLGAEFRFAGAAVRLGAAYDVSPVPNRTVDPTLTDNDRIIGSIGLGYDFGYVSLDVAYMALYLLPRTVTGEDNNVNFPPPTPEEEITYEGFLAHIVSVGLGVQL